MSNDDAFDAILAEARLPEQEVPLCLDPRLTHEYETLKAARRRDSLSDDTLGRLAELEEQIRQKTVTFTVQAMPRDDYRDLLTRHPADPENKQDTALGYDLQGFMEALVKKCVTEPKMTPKRWKQLDAVLSSGQWKKLYNAAHSVNAADGGLPF